jgi:hypothetical protein
LDALVSWLRAVVVWVGKARRNGPNLTLLASSIIALWKSTKTGHVVTCYYSAGTSEDWREDVQSNVEDWNDVAVGTMDQWDGEAWLVSLPHDQN